MEFFRVVSYPYGEIKGRLKGCANQLYFGCVGQMSKTMMPVQMG